jgi:hypothetical protein
MRGNFSGPDFTFRGLYIPLVIKKSNHTLNTGEATMPASQPSHQPLARLVLFMICLAIAGSAVAAVHYYAVDLPAQAALPAPHNGLSPTPETCTRENMNKCESDCIRPDGVLDLNCYENCLNYIC